MRLDKDLESAMPMHRYGMRDRTRDSISRLHPLTISSSHPDPRYNFQERNYSDGGIPSGTLQRTLDKNSTYWKNQRFRNKYADRFDLGGPFYSERVTLSPAVINFTGTRQLSKGLQTGSVNGSLDNMMEIRKTVQRLTQGERVGWASPLSPAAIRGWGTEGINRTMPKKSEMSVATAAIETIRDLPRLPGRALARDPSLHSLGSEYLNYMFGIKPTVGDGQDIIRLTKSYEQILRQMKRDNGRLIRRRRTLKTEEDTTTSSPRITQLYPWTDGVGKACTVYSQDCTRTIRTIDRVWFSAAYKTSYPTALDSRLDELREFNRVYGVIPDVNTLWQVLPWSWLVDWFFDVGTLIENASTLGNQIDLHYAYVMAQSTYTDSIEGNAFTDSGLFISWRNAKIPFKQVRSHTVKVRTKASPFGFHVDRGSLSNYQKSILTALGVSRLRF